MFGIKQKGFTFLELLFALLLLGLIVSVFIPNLRVLLPGYKRKEFLNELNVLLQNAWQNALITQKMHRLWFDIPNRIARVEIEEELVAQKPIYKPLVIPYMKLEYQWPENIIIKNIYIEGIDMLHKPGIKTETVWFYVVPDGLVQAVIINYVDTNELDEQKKPFQVGLSINPFSAKITAQEEFATP